jgi:Tfp pilus assembly protein PilF
MSEAKCADPADGLKARIDDCIDERTGHRFASMVCQEQRTNEVIPVKTIPTAQTAAQLEAAADTGSLMRAPRLLLAGLVATGLAITTAGHAQAPAAAPTPAPAPAKSAAPAAAPAQPATPGIASAPVPADCTQKADLVKAVASCTAYLKEFGKSATKTSDRLASAHSSRATAFSGQGLHKQALADITRALYHGPKDAKLWYQRGQIRTALGQNIRCAADHAIALRYDAKMTEALVGRGDCYRRLGALPKAIADADAALKLDPKSASAYAMRSYANLRLGKADVAVTDAEEALKIDPNSARAYLTRGLAQETKDKAKAEADVKKAVALDPALKAEKGLAVILKRFAL